jgi:hypothetical protein
VNEQETKVRAAALGGRPNSSGWIRINCPACPDRGRTPDRDRSLGVNSSTWRYVCWRCGARGWACEWDGNDAPDVRVVFPFAAETPGDGFEWPDGPEEFVPLWTDDARRSPACAGPIRYLGQRGFKRSHAALANIGACFEGRYVGRVIVPHTNLDGTWWGWSARSYTKRRQPKNLFPPGMVRRMFNDDAVLVRTDEPLLVVEGVFDALRYMPNAVACLGKPTPTHEKLLAKRRRPVIVALDGDAWEEGVMLAERLSLDGDGPRVQAVRLPPKTDPDTYDVRTLPRIG